MEKHELLESVLDLYDHIDCCITDLVYSRLHHNEEMEKTSKAINEYENRLQYLLEKSDMFVWKFDLVNRQINFSRSLRSPGYTMSRDEFVNYMFDDEREEADQKLIGMIQQGFGLAGILLKW